MTIELSRILFISDETQKKHRILREIELLGFAIQEASLDSLNDLGPIPEIKMAMLDLSASGEDIDSKIRAVSQNNQIEKLPLVALMNSDNLCRLSEPEGIDEIIVYPCSISEILMRLYMASMPGRAREGRFGEELAIDMNRFEVKIGERAVPLAPMEFRLLKYLALNNGKVCEREAILNEVWGESGAEKTRKIDIHVARLRSKLGQFGKLITTVKKVGYRCDIKPARNSQSSKGLRDDSIDRNRSNIDLDMTHLRALWI